MKVISIFLAENFIMFPEAVSEPCATSLHFPTYTRVLEYVRETLHVQKHDPLELLVAIALWHHKVDFNWREVADVSSLPWKRQASSLLVSVEFLDKTGTLDDAVVPSTGCGVPEAWARALCEAAGTVNCVKRCESLAVGNAWCCQFAGMDECLGAAYEYFMDTLRMGCAAWERDLERATEVKALYASHCPSGHVAVDFTDASIPFARLPVKDCENDFTWMFVAAAVLVALESKKCGLPAAARLVLNSEQNAGAGAWRDVRIPIANATALYKAAASSAFEKNADVGKTPLQTCASDSVPLLALQMMLFSPSGGFKYTPVPSGRGESRFTFEESPFAPPQTAFVAALTPRQVGSVELHARSTAATAANDAAFATARDLGGTMQPTGLLRTVCGAIEELFGSSAVAPDAMMATATASALLHPDINCMFKFGDCVARASLCRALRKHLEGCSEASCFYALPGSLVTHASSALWSWMFTYVEGTDDFGKISALKMMALACQASVMHPDLEQLALWSSYARLCRRPGVPDVSPDPEAPGSSSSSSAVPFKCGKLTGATIGESICASFDTFEGEEEIHAAHVQHLQLEQQMRAAVAISSPSGISACQFTRIGCDAYRHAAVTRLLLRGNWDSADAVAAMKCALFAPDDEFETFIVSLKSPTAPLPTLIAPHVGVEDCAELSLYIAVMVDAVNLTAGQAVKHANATLQYIQPVKLLETVVNRIATACVRGD